MSICVSSKFSLEKSLSLFKQDIDILQKNIGLDAFSDWTNLPDGVSNRILGILGHSKDFLSFALTCRAWSTLFIKEEILDLSFYPLLKDSQLIALMQMLKEKRVSAPHALNIHTVNLSGCLLLTQKSISTLQSCPLITLNLYGCSIDYKCMNSLKCLTYLQHLHLDKLYRGRCYTSLDTVSQEELNPLDGLHLKTLSLGHRRLSIQTKKPFTAQKGSPLEILSLGHRSLSLPIELTASHKSLSLEILSLGHRSISMPLDVNSPHDGLSLEILSLQNPRLPILPGLSSPPTPLRLDD